MSEYFLHGSKLVKWQRMSVGLLNQRWLWMHRHGCDALSTFLKLRISLDFDLDRERHGGYPFSRSYAINRVHSSHRVITWQVRNSRNPSTFMSTTPSGGRLGCRHGFGCPTARSAAVLEVRPYPHLYFYSSLEGAIKINIIIGLLMESDI